MAIRFRKYKFDNSTGTLTVDGTTIQSSTGYLSGLKRIHLRRTSDLAIADATAYYPTWDTQTHIDTSHFTHSTSTNADNITVNVAGVYNIIGNFTFNNSTGVQRNTLRVLPRLNGTNINEAATYDYDRGTDYGQFSNNKVNTIVECSANDVIDFQIYGQNVDGTPVLDATFSEILIWYMGTA